MSIDKKGGGLALFGDARKKGTRYRIGDTLMKYSPLKDIVEG